MAAVLEASAFQAGQLRMPAMVQSRNEYAALLFMYQMLMTCSALSADAQRWRTQSIARCLTREQLLPGSGICRPGPAGGPRGLSESGGSAPLSQAADWTPPSVQRALPRRGPPSHLHLSPRSRPGTGPMSRSQERSGIALCKAPKICLCMVC